MADVCYFVMKVVGEPVNLCEWNYLLQRKGPYQKDGIRWISLDSEIYISEKNDELKS